jgi:GT2 family glycosyltransferase
MVAREFPRVDLIRNETNRGFAQANNQAAALAKGRYLFFLNNDTVVPRGALRNLCDYARTHPETGLIGPRLRDPKGRTQVSWRQRPTVGALLHRVSWLRWTGLFRKAYSRYRGRAEDPTQTRPVEVLMGAALFLRRRLFKQSGGWNEAYTFGGEDIDLCTRINRLVEPSHAVVHHPGVSILHHGRVCSRQHIGYAYAQTVVGITRFLRQNGCPRPALWLYKAALTVDAPLQWFWHAVQFCCRRLRGRHAQAQRSLLVLRAAGYFIARGLVPLWKV